MKDYAEKYCDKSLPVLARAMAKLREKHGIQKAKTSELWAEHEYLSKKLIPEQMEHNGIVVMVVKGLGRLELRHEASCSIPAEKRQEVYQWMRDNGYGDLIQGTVNSSTFKAQVKKWIRDGEDFPMELINFNPFENAVLVKAK